MYWKKRYDEFGVERLMTIKRPGRHIEIDAIEEEGIKTKLSRKDYWKSSQTSSIVREKSGIKYTQRHIRRLVQKWGYALITTMKKHKSSVFDEGGSLKKSAEILGSLRKGMTEFCTDESILVYDSIVRKFWAKRGSKPRVTTTVPHKKMFLSGVVALDGTTIFRSYESITSKEFISFLNAL